AKPRTAPKLGLLEFGAWCFLGVWGLEAGVSYYYLLSKLARAERVWVRTRSTASLKRCGKIGTRWNASLPGLTRCALVGVLATICVSSWRVGSLWGSFECELVQRELESDLA